MVDEGHALGNHSWDHRYRNYFFGAHAMRRWIEHTRLELRALGLPQAVGFRPPAGVVTPVVKRVARDLGEPLVLWDERFYDAVWPWTEAKARRSAARLRGGEIVLLHDRQPGERGERFAEVLALYLDLLQERGFDLVPLQRPASDALSAARSEFARRMRPPPPQVPGAGESSSH